MAKPTIDKDTTLWMDDGNNVFKKLGTTNDFSFTVSYDSYDAAFNYLQAVSPLSVDLEFKSEKLWFVPTFVIDKSVLNTQITEANGFVYVNLSTPGSNIERVFAHWYHRPIWYLWNVWCTGKRKVFG